MLIELYIFVMIIGFIFFFTAFFTTGRPNSELFWGATVIIFAILGASSSVVQSLEPFYNATGGHYYIASYNHVDLVLVWFNLLFYGISSYHIIFVSYGEYGKLGKDK